MAGGEPFGVVVGDYQLRYDPRTNYFDRDISVLSKISQSAAAAFSPFVMSASPEIFGVNTFAELSSTRDVAAQFEQIDYVKWRQLRDNDDTKFIGLTAPNVLFDNPTKVMVLETINLNFKRILTIQITIYCGEVEPSVLLLFRLEHSKSTVGLLTCEE